MGMIVSVYRGAHGDCTNGGISAKADKLCIVNVEGPFKPTDEMPAAMLDKSRHGVIRIVPVVWNPEHQHWQPCPKWYMNGGNFAATSDSRFREAVEKLGGTPAMGVPVFDRHEA